MYLSHRSADQDAERNMCGVGNNLLEYLYRRAFGCHETESDLGAVQKFMFSEFQNEN